MSRKAVYLMMLVLAAVLVGCAQGVTALAPPEIRYGQDVCAGCNMVIEGPRFAAAYTHEIGTGNFESLPFDDIGGMVRFSAMHPDHQVVRWWVHDYNTEEWVDGSTAYYVASENIQSPMGFGLAALAQQADAEALAAETGGTVLDWEGLREHVAAMGNKQP